MAALWHWVYHISYIIEKNWDTYHGFIRKPRAISPGSTPDPPDPSLPSWWPGAQPLTGEFDDPTGKLQWLLS